MGDLATPLVARPSATSTMEKRSSRCKPGSSEEETTWWHRLAPLSCSIAQFGLYVNRECAARRKRLGSDAAKPLWRGRGVGAGVLRPRRSSRPPRSGEGHRECAAGRKRLGTDGVQPLRLCAGRAYPRGQVETRRHRWMPPRGPWRHLYHMEYSRCELGTGRSGRFLVLCL